MRGPTSPLTWLVLLTSLSFLLPTNFILFFFAVGHLVSSMCLHTGIEIYALLPLALKCPEAHSQKRIKSTFQGINTFTLKGMFSIPLAGILQHCSYTLSCLKSIYSIFLFKDLHFTGTHISLSSGRATVQEVWEHLKFHVHF